MSFKVILFGGGRLLIEIIDHIKNKHDLLVITCGRHLSDMKKYLDEECIDYIVSDNVNTHKAVKKEIKDGDIGLSISASWIFKKDFIDLFKGNLFNLHGSRLPQDKGGGGFSWRIMNNNRMGYCVIHRISERIDQGDIIKYKEFIFPARCKTPQDYMSATNLRYLNLVLEFLKEGVKEECKQLDYFSMYWPRLNCDVHGWINWSWSVDEIKRFIYAFDNPYAGARTCLNALDGLDVRLKKATVFYKDGNFHPFQAGIIYRKKDNILWVACRGGTLIVEEIKDIVGNNITDGIKIGDRLYTPVKELEQAYKRIYY